MKTNPVLDAIRNRRSVRTYDPRPLPADVLATIVEAGTLAPTGMNAQTFHFTVIQDAEKLPRTEPADPHGADPLRRPPAQ